MSKDLINLILGAVAFFCFLVLGSEPLPGENPGVWPFLWPKIVAFAVMLLCCYGIRETNKQS